jgi:hypothetical protein
MSLEKVLLAVPPQQWVTRQVIAFDWYDGPRSGACALSHPPAEFFFDLVAERWNEDGLDYRLFRLGELPQGTVLEMEAAYSEFQTEALRSGAQKKLKSLETRARPTSIIVLTQDMKTFQGCWEVTHQPNTRDIDWFSLLNVAPELLRS